MADSPLDLMKCRRARDEFGGTRRSLVNMLPRPKSWGKRAKRKKNLNRQDAKNAKKSKAEIECGKIRRGRDIASALYFNHEFFMAKRCHNEE
jgi:hypothetical protein